MEKIGKILGIIAIVALLTGSVPFIGRLAAAPDGEVIDFAQIELPEKGNPKLDSQLNQLVSAEMRKQAASFAQESNIELVDCNVRVIVESQTGQAEAANKAAGALGNVETSYRNLIQAVVPIPRLTALAETPAIRFVRLPHYPVPDVTSEGVGLIGADDWQSANITGSGVKVAILDVGFSGYTTRGSTTRGSTGYTCGPPTRWNLPLVASGYGLMLPGG